MLILAGGIGNPGNLYTEPQQLLIAQEKKLFSDLSHKQSFLKNIVSGYPSRLPAICLNLHVYGSYSHDLYKTMYKRYLLCM